jgi:hypothetical protein
MNKLVIINLSAETPQSLGTLHFQQMPHPGDWIETEDVNHQSVFYEVIKIVHSAQGNGADLYVANPRPGTEARADLHRSFLEKHPL